jgi:probable biosynthetic protein (TIGR04099 family)
MNRFSKYLIGMPHLSFLGLSENWLLKQCGDLHWSMLAEGVGSGTSDFRDAHGRRLYAAFVAIQLNECALERIREDDLLEIASDLKRVSRTQYKSHHILQSGGRACGSVSMISVFIRRTVDGSNRGVERGPLAREGAAVPFDSESENALAMAAKGLRLENWTHMDFSPAGQRDLATFEFRPCRYGDFNGAMFLYFASFQSIVDRAESVWWPQAFPFFTTARRDLFYHSNIDLGETVTAMLRGCREDGPVRTHWVELRRKVDGFRIADIFTEKIAISDGLDSARSPIGG